MDKSDLCNEQEISNMQESLSDRGFMHVDFTDDHGEPCRLMESSAIGPYDNAFENPGTSFVWLGRNEDAMHLSREQVEELVLRLSRWLEGKRLTIEG